MESPVNENHGHNEQTENAQNPTNQETSSYDGKLITAILICVAIVIGVLVYKYGSWPSSNSSAELGTESRPYSQQFTYVGQEVKIPAVDGKLLYWKNTVDVNITDKCGHTTFGEGSAPIPNLGLDKCNAILTFSNLGTIGRKQTPDPGGTISWWYK